MTNATSSRALGPVLTWEGPEVVDDDGRQKRIIQAALAVKLAVEAHDFKPPLLPEVAMRLTQMSGRPNTTVDSVEKVVATDPTVTARVLARANSASFFRGVPIQSLRVAVTRLGLSEVRDVAFDMVARSRLFKVAEHAARMRELLDASRAAGQLAREVCKKLRIDTDLAFLCGLLHDMGEAIILGIVTDTGRKLGAAIPAEIVADLVAKFHACVGSRVCEVWRLPPAISDAIAFHHDPARSTHPSQMARVVAVADRLLEHAGIGVAKRPAEPLKEPIFYSINLVPDDVEQLLETATQIEAELSKGVTD
jgi:putative nucleotidyltransferase with HDIG domain